VLASDESYDGPPVANAQGNMVARRRSDGSVVLADLGSGVVLGTVPPLALKSGMAFTPDGARLITVAEAAQSGDALLVQRDISDEALVRTACGTAGRDLAPAEWQAFVGTATPGELACR
jgi:hypothetical protein